jgi:hypothetical protein
MLHYFIEFIYFILFYNVKKIAVCDREIMNEKVQYWSTRQKQRIPHKRKNEKNEF